MTQSVCALVHSVLLGEVEVSQDCNVSKALHDCVHVAVVSVILKTNYTPSQIFEVFDC